MWPSIIIGFNIIYSLNPPGFINLPNELVYSPETWSGIIHEITHHVLMNNTPVKIRELVDIINQMFENQ
ncbi:unnamed protein product, partial [marine sediment metagenome]